MPPNGEGIMQSIPEMSGSLPIRKGPQFTPEILNILNMNNISLDGNNNENPLHLLQLKPQLEDNKHIKEDNDKAVPHVVPEISPPIPQTPAPNRFPSQPIDPTPKPFQRISGFNKKQTENRIHFPTDTDKNQVVSQPILSDTMPSTAPLNRPSKPIQSNPFHTQYSGPNKFRLKPAIGGQTVGSQMPSYGNQLKPNGRLPPFLLPNTNPQNVQSVNAIRHKPNTGSVPHVESNTQIRPETPPLAIEVSAPVNNQNSFANESRAESITSRPNPLLSEPQSTTASSESNHSVFTTPRPTTSTTKTQPLVTIKTQTANVSIVKSSPTTTSTPKSTPNAGNKINNSWDLFRVSGCNIYGVMYEIDAPIDRLSTDCKKCICSTQGVKCTDTC
ncbi:unnamed protein product [Medioppia subpectinata]|uniref:Uncharacterized protein n=1 Tax=Medioppia subpectinata TaxID=1979941 RepID=A0A7R9Q4Y9_9ACAR|nr:unnamed protein product [Medioppia subpectinata]CAG2113207.1 unnamed protein product [Medioppia subpectinata]